jgi:stringent starvation protein B
MSTPVMTSNRSYLLRAMYDWIADNGLTPYILVDAASPGVSVPQHAIKDGRVVLNIAARAVAQLELGKDLVNFVARFSGVSQSVHVPMAAILAIYAQENGQGMMFPAESGTTPPSAPDTGAKKGPHLRVVK